MTVAPARPSLADWDLTERVAGLVAGIGAPTISREEAEELRAHLHDAVRRAEPLARAATGLGNGIESATCHVVGRRAWIRANVASISWLVDPLAETVLQRAGVSRVVARQALGLQLGVVLGYLASRVLGQYEALLPGDHTPGRLLLVGPNLIETERVVLPETGVPAEEFRFGVVLHELAHWLQFEGVPWLRPHLKGLLDQYLSDARVDADRLKEIAGRVPELLRDPARLTDPMRLAEIILTPAQTDVLARAQAMMSLLEGHGNVVMDWGAELADGAQAPGFDPSRVRRVLNARRSKAAQQAMRAALGLSMKARQYLAGEAFILAVAERHGRDAFHQVWEDPDHLPTTEELDDPDAWAARLAR